LVSKPLDLSMNDIVNLPYIEIPVTLVCAGNRRKEENMIKQSIGFNWGAAAVSTSVWKGVPLNYVLKMAGVSLDDDSEEPRYVCFKGADKLPNGYYGTSLPLEWSMSSVHDVILAYEMNGEKLTPDHGFPIRLIIPGAIGGRMVKWLTRITVSNKESDSYYHHHDNRVLPPEYDAERATKEKIWNIPDYIINELNINSVITSPAHDERLQLSSSDITSSYDIKGYAYTGGGRKVIRVEVSLDGGNSWLLTNVTHPEIVHPNVLKRKRNPIRRYWCWAFWSISVPIYSLIRYEEICVRAWDASQNTQPKDITWNVMGMMNNCHFRVKVSIITQGSDVVLLFAHPTQPGENPGGWMPKPDDSLNSTPPKKDEPGNGMPKFSIDQISKHDSKEDCWIIVDKRVYDCTKFLEQHPGGADSILMNAGTDCSGDFNAIHSSKAKSMLSDYYIGDLIDTYMPKSSEKKISNQSTIQWLSCSLTDKKCINNNTRIFRFTLQSPNHLDLPIGNHFLIRAIINEQTVIRSYTPIKISPGYFDLLIKVYFKNTHPKYPNGGLMSQHMEELRIGDCIEVKGPLGTFAYNGRGQYQIKNGTKETLHKCKKISLICGGSGITPAYQVIQSVFRDPKDNTELSLIYANRSESDVLLRNELDGIAIRDKRFKVYYTLDDPPKDWPYGKGFISETMIRERLHAPMKDAQSIVLMCGPPPMLEFACIPNLKKIGFKDSEYFIF
ncbi:2613_t:CDS:2, partial [Racocetra persica]